MASVSDSGSDSDVGTNRKRANRSDSEDDESVARSNRSDDSDSSDSDEEARTRRSTVKKARVSRSVDSDDSDKSEPKKSDSSDGDDSDDDAQRSASPKRSPVKDSDDDSNDSDNEPTRKSDSDVERSDKDEQKSDGGSSVSGDQVLAKKRSKVVASSDDEQLDGSSFEKSAKNNFKDIFGDLSSEDEEDCNKKVSKSPSPSDRGHRQDDDYEEEEDRDPTIEERIAMHRQFLEDEDQEAEDEPLPETRIDVTIPRIQADLGKEMHFIKLPNFLSVDTHPYNAQWYEDEIDDDEVCDEEGRGRMKLKVENTIRWRQVLDDNNQLSKESNARFVRWSDGSMSLYLGNEIFDIHKQQLLSGDNNHLYIRQGTGLQGQAVFKTKLTFRPHSTDSFTHKKMTLSLADRSQKTQKIRVLATVGKDPEVDRWAKMKKEDEKLRAAIKRENKVMRNRERANQRGPTSSYLEPDADDDDDDGAISLSAIKNKYKKGNYSNVYSDSGSDSGGSGIFDKKKTGTTKKTGRIEESDDDD